MRDMTNVRLTDPRTKIVDIEKVAVAATRAALSAIDSATNGKTQRSRGACGDKLAYKIDQLIREAMTDYSLSDAAPPFTIFINQNIPAHQQ